MKAFSSILIGAIGIIFTVQGEPIASDIARVKHDVEQFSTKPEEITDWRKLVDIHNHLAALPYARQRLTVSTNDGPTPTEMLFTLRLKLLNAAFTLRDKTYDVTNNHVHLNVMPPLRSAPFIYPGMSTNQIKDPVLREQYVRDIEANGILVEKHNKEVELQQYIDREIVAIRMEVKSQRKDSTGRARLLELIKTEIKDEKFQSVLSEPFRIDMTRTLHP